MKVLSDIRQFNKSQWQKLLDESKFASFFQSLECYKFYAAQECFEPFIFGVEEQGVLKGVIVGYIQKEKGALKGYLSRRAIINAGPLLAKDIDVADLSISNEDYPFLLSNLIGRTRDFIILPDGRKIH